MMMCRGDLDLGLYQTQARVRSARKSWDLSGGLHDSIKQLYYAATTADVIGKTYRTMRRSGSDSQAGRGPVPAGIEQGKAASGIQFDCIESEIECRERRGGSNTAAQSMARDGIDSAALCLKGGRRLCSVHDKKLTTQKPKMPLCKHQIRIRYSTEVISCRPFSPLLRASSCGPGSAGPLNGRGRPRAGF